MHEIRSKTRSRQQPSSKQPMDGGLTMRQTVAARLEAAFSGTEVSWKFGHASFETEEGKVYCFITRDGNLAMKLPPARIEPLLEEGQATPLRMGLRTMREWVVVLDPESPSTLKLLREAKVYVESLPKSARKSALKKPPASAKKKSAKTAPAKKTP